MAILGLVGGGNIGLLVLRVFLAVIFFYHGFPKTSRIKGGTHGDGKKKMALFMKFIGFIEIICAILLVLGFLTQAVSIVLILIMLGAISMKIFSWKIPFSTMSNTGWEFDFMILGATLALALLGAGNISLDYLFNFYP